MPHRQVQSVLWHLRRLVSAPVVNESADGDLLERFIRQRDEAAFATLLQRHGPMVWGVCRRLLADGHQAEDAFQATFLVLVRKANSIGDRSRLAGWLYGVALRIAQKARVQAAKRQACEKEMHDMPTTANPDSVTWRDLGNVLDEEVHRLPAKYREPFILCCLEGKTNAEAAAQLGCPEGTLSSQLTRARERLRAQLGRRGIVLSAGGLAAFLSEKAAPAAVPDPVIRSAMQIAVWAATGRAAAGGVSAQALALSEGVVKTMFLTKLRMAAALLLALGLGSFVGTFTYHSLAKGASGKSNEEPALLSGNGATKPEEKGKTDPPGVPLELKLVAKKDTYTLDLGGKTAEQFQQLVKDAENLKGFPKYPPAPEVDLVAELHNTGDHELQVCVRGDEFGVGELKLNGPGAINKVAHLLPNRIPQLDPTTQVITLKPGGSHALPLRRLAFDNHYDGYFNSYWTQPGEHTLTLKCRTLVTPVPRGAKEASVVGPGLKPLQGYASVLLTSDPLKLKVVEEKGQGQLERKMLPVLARGDWPHNLSQQHVIRSLEDVIAALPDQDRPQDAEARKALAAVWANVNWKERMLLVVPGMDLPDPLYSASLNGVSVRGKDVTVHWTLKRRSGNAPAVVVKGYPTALWVDRIEGPASMPGPLSGRMRSGSAACSSRGSTIG